MDNSAFLLGVKDILAGNMGVSAADLNEDTIIKSLQLSSITFIRIVVEIEEKFDIEFDDDMLDPKNIINIGDLCAFIISAKNASESDK